MKSTEKATQKAILEYLALKRIFHYRNNTGGFKNSNGNFYTFGAKGSPDIVCVVPKNGIGQFVGIEVKDVKGKLNDNQEKFKKELEKAGGIYITARSLDDITPFL